MKAVILGNGTYGDLNYYKDYIYKYNPDIIICADGGLKTALKVGIIPHVLLGDFDSVEKEQYEYIKEKAKIVTYEKRKDFTDVSLCLKYAAENGYNDIVLFGVLGTRFDHSLVNVYLLKYAFDNFSKARIINEYNEIFLINNYIRLSGVKNKTISVLPYSDVIDGIYLKGFSYPLYNAVMYKENPYGVSNYADNDTVEIKINSGTALIVITQDNY